MKKTIAMCLMIFVIGESGCAVSTVKVSSLSEVPVAQAYRYEIKLTGHRVIRDLSANKISIKDDGILYEKKNVQKFVKRERISSIIATNIQRQGSYIVPGTVIGGTIGAIPGAMVLGGCIFLSAFDYAPDKHVWVKSMEYMGIGAGAGAALGALIGWLISKHEKIEFIPVVENFASAEKTLGGNFQFKF